MFVVSTDEVIDRFTQLFDIDKAGSLERLAAQNAKPALNLIEPGSASGRKVQMHVRMALEPAVVLGFVGAELSDFDRETELFCTLSPSPPPGHLKNRVTAQIAKHASGAAAS